MSDTTTTIGTGTGDGGAGAGTDTKTNDTGTVTDGGQGDKGVDLAAQVATLTAQLTELSTKAAAAEAAAEAAKREKMSDAEKLAADRAELDKQRTALANRARGDALTRLGVIEKAHQWAPQVDPGTPEGAKALEDWAKANPELVKRTDPGGQNFQAPPDTPLAELLSGKRKSPLLSAGWAQKLLGGK